MQPAAELKASRAGLEKLAAPGNAGLVRQTALAALITADGSVDAAWNGATKNPAALSDFLEALPRVSDPALRGSAFDKVLPLLTTMPPEIAAALSNKSDRQPLATCGSNSRAEAR